MAAVGMEVQSRTRGQVTFRTHRRWRWVAGLILVQERAEGCCPPSKSKQARDAVYGPARRREPSGLRAAESAPLAACRQASCCGAKNGNSHLVSYEGATFGDVLSIGIGSSSLSLQTPQRAASPAERANRPISRKPQAATEPCPFMGSSGRGVQQCAARLFRSLSTGNPRIASPEMLLWILPRHAACIRVPRSDRFGSHRYAGPIAHFASCLAVKL